MKLEILEVIIRVCYPSFLPDWEVHNLVCVGLKIFSNLKEFGYEFACAN